MTLEELDELVRKILTNTHRLYSVPHGGILIKRQKTFKRIIRDVKGEHKRALSDLIKQKHG